MQFKEVRYNLLNCHRIFSPAFIREIIEETGITSDEPYSYMVICELGKTNLSWLYSETQKYPFNKFLLRTIKYYTGHCRMTKKSTPRSIL